MLLPVLTDDGAPVGAHFRVKPSGARWDLVLESRGGAKGKDNERNSGYGPGLRVLIERIATLGLTIADGFVESHDSQVRNLSEDERRLRCDGLAFPLVLQPSADLDAVTVLLRQGQRDIGSRRVKGGGNTTRRIRLVLEFEPGAAAVVNLGASLSRGPETGPVSGAAIEAVAKEIDSAAGFDPTSLADARERTLASIAVRQGQPQFRKALLQAYGGRCALSACEVEAALEAAHIVPYLGARTNHVQNGILLRGDLHALFDRGLLGVNPETWTVVLHDDLQGTSYESLRGAAVSIPVHEKFRPSPEAFRRHLEAAGLAPV
jgi:putative restriction endonuclease